MNERMNDARHWRERAAEMRAIADWMKNPETTSIMVRLAEDYDSMADRAERGFYQIWPYLKEHNKI